MILGIKSAVVAGGLALALAGGGWAYVSHVKSARDDALAEAEAAQAAADAYLQAAEDMKAQAEALALSRDEAARDARDATRRLQGASGECLDKGLPPGLLD